MQEDNTSNSIEKPVTDSPYIEIPSIIFIVLGVLLGLALLFLLVLCIVSCLPQ